MFQTIHCQSCGRLTTQQSIDECQVCGSRLVEQFRAVPRTTQPPQRPGKSSQADRFSKFYLSSLLSLGIGLFGLFASYRLDSITLTVLGVLAILGSLFLGLLSIITAMQIVHHAWSVLNCAEEFRDDAGRIEPTLAVVLLFVPIVNLYWFFRVFPGWAYRAQACLQRRKLSLMIVPKELHLGLAICQWIPGLNLLTVILYPLCIINMAKTTELLDSGGTIHFQSSRVDIETPVAAVS